MTSNGLLSIAVLQAFQLSLLIGFVWLVTRTVTKQSAHLSYALWLVVLLKCFTPPIWSSPLGIFSWLHADRSSAPTEEIRVEDDQVPTILGPNTRKLDPLDLPRAEQRPTAAPPPRTEIPTSAAAAPGVTHTASPVPTISPPVGEPNVSSAAQAGWWVATAWLGIAVLMALWTVCSAQRCIRRLTRSCIADDELQRKTRELGEALKLKSAVHLLVTSCPVGPAVIGLFRPTIVVPEFIAQQRTVEEMEPILAHELIHIRRGDLWIGMLRHLARSLWWFHPLVWKTSSAVRRGAEQCCDEEVIATLKISPSGYARALLGVLELKHELKMLPVVPGVRPIDITSKRMERIMKLRHGSHAKSPLWCWAIALSVALLSLPGAGLAVGGGSDPPSTNVPAVKTQRAPAPAGQQIGPTPPVIVAPRGHEAKPPHPDKPVVKLECWFVTGRDRDIRSIRVDWQVMAGSTSKANDVEKNEGKRSQPAHEDGHGQSRVVTEKQLPIAYGILGADQTRDLIEKLRGEQRFTVFCAPVITVSDNMTGTVHTGNERPFVVGVQGGRHEVRTIDCGFTCQLRPQIQRDEPGTETTDVSLSYELVTTNVLNVGEVTWHTADGAGITVQIPETQSALISGTNLIPTGKSLAIHGLLPMNANDQRESTLIVVRPKVMLPPKVAKNDEQDASTVQGVTRDHGGNLRENGSKDTDIASAGADNKNDVSAISSLRATSRLNKDQGLDEIPTSAEPQYRERWRLTLEECIAIGLQNSHMIRELGIRIHEPISETSDAAASTPLLRGEPTVTRVKKLLTGMKPDDSMTEVKRDVRNYLLEVTRSYWDLYFCNHNLDAARTGFTHAHATWKKVKTRQVRGDEGGEAASEAQARAQFFAFRSRLEQAASDLYSAESRLRYLLGVSATDGRLIQPIDKPTKARFEVDWEAAKQIALDRHPEIRRARERIKEQTAELLATQEELLPIFGAEALNRFMGWENRTDSKPVVGNSDDLTEDEAQEWQLGFAFQMPLGLRRELTHVRNSQLRLLRSEKVLDEIQLEVTHQLSAAVRFVQDQYQIAQTAFNALVAYRDHVEANTTAYENSKTIQLDLLLGAQRNLAQSEADYVRAIASYQQAIAEFNFRTCTLVETYGYAFAEQERAVDLDTALDPVSASVEHADD